MRFVLASLILVVAAVTVLPATGVMASDIAIETMHSPAFTSPEREKDLPWPIFLAGSIIVPLAVLFVFSFAVKRGSGGH